MKIKPIESVTELHDNQPVKNGVIAKFTFPYKNENLAKLFGLNFRGF